MRLQNNPLNTDQSHACTRSIDSGWLGTTWQHKTTEIHLSCHRGKNRSYIKCWRPDWDSPAEKERRKMVRTHSYVTDFYLLLHPSQRGGNNASGPSHIWLGSQECQVNRTSSLSSRKWSRWRTIGRTEGWNLKSIARKLQRSFFKTELFLDKSLASSFKDEAGWTC